MDFANIGFGNMVSKSKIVTIIMPDAAPIKRIVQESKEQGMLIDATCGRKTKAVIVMDSGHVVLSGLSVDTLSNKLSGKNDLDCEEVIDE